MIRQRLLKDQVLSDRERKNIAILELIGKSGPMTKTDISKITELNIVTVSNYINNYIKAGLVEEKGFDVSSGGRKPTLIDLNYKSGYVVGVGITNSFEEIRAVIVDYGSNLILEKSMDWNASDRSEKLIESMGDLVESLISESSLGVDCIKGMGVALPGIIDERGATVKWPSSVGDVNISVCISVRSVLEKRFRIPIFIEKADTSAVAGERWLGLNSDVQNVLFMYSGIGCGLMMNGQLYRGTSGTAGELGVFNMHGDDLGNEFPALGKSSLDLGIFSAVSSSSEGGTAVKVSERKRLEEIVLASSSGNTEAMEAIQHAAKSLGLKVSFLVNLLNPEVVVIGGGIEAAGPIFLDIVRKTVKNWSVEEAANVVKIIPSALGENLLPMGAACVVIQELFAQV